MLSESESNDAVETCEGGNKVSGALREKQDSNKGMKLIEPNKECIRSTIFF